ncbi:ABC transporter permease [Paenibacillus sp. D51F]
MSEYLLNHYDDLLKGLWEHLLLSASALAIALLIALPAGYWLSRHGRIAVPVLAVLGVVYAIPSLGMFALLIPLLGLGKQPALAALVLYSQLVLIRNVISGFRSIEPAVRESASGAGFGRWRLFMRIELPLALPVILGGVRIASLSIIGIATIAAWINAGGLGVILFEGLYQNSVPKMVWGTVLVALLAISVNQLLLALERRSIRRAAGEG